MIVRKYIPPKDDAMRPPRNFLVQILVAVNPGGSFTTNIFSYFDNKSLPANQPLEVQGGDEVGFLVQIAMPSGRQLLPYTIGFSDSSFFGVTSLNVPAGGMSAYLRVLSLKGLAKYTLTVTGLGVVLDPDIQSGSDTGMPGALARDPATFVFTWDTVQQTATYTMNGVAVPYSTQVIPKDTVEFIAVVGVASATNFTVVFAGNVNHWATPFDPNRSSFVPAGASPKDIGPLRVTDTGDTGNSFPFTASISVNGNPVNLPVAINPYIQM